MALARRGESVPCVIGLCHVRQNCAAPVALWDASQVAESGQLLIPGNSKYVFYKYINSKELLKFVFLRWILNLKHLLAYLAQIYVPSPPRNIYYGSCKLDLPGDTWQLKSFGQSGFPASVPHKYGLSPPARVRGRPRGQRESSDLACLPRKKEELTIQCLALIIRKMFSSENKWYSNVAWSMFGRQVWLRFLWESFSPVLFPILMGNSFIPHFYGGSFSKSLKIRDKIILKRVLACIKCLIYFMLYSRPYLGYISSLFLLIFFSKYRILCLSACMWKRQGDHTGSTFFQWTFNPSPWRKLDLKIILTFHIPLEKFQ